MPNFTIRRRKKTAPEPEPEKEPEPIQPEESESSSEAESEGTLMDRVIPEAQKPDPPPQPRRQPQYRPQRRDQFEEPEKVAQRPPTYVRQQPQRTDLRRQADPYLRKPTMPVPPRSRHKQNERKRFRYSTHYGANGDVLDTQAKAFLLLRHCFG